MLSDGELLIVGRSEMNFVRPVCGAIDCLITSALYRSDQLSHLPRLLCSVVIIIIIIIVIIIIISQDIASSKANSPHNVI